MKNKENNVETAEQQQVRLQAEDKIKERAKEMIQGAYIALAVDIEAAFKLYSYRIITPENYRERIDQLLNMHLEVTKNTN